MEAAEAKVAEVKAAKANASDAKMQKEGTTQGEQDDQADVNQGEEGPQTIRPTLQFPPPR